MRNLILVFLAVSLALILFLPLSIYLLLFKKWNWEEIKKLYKMVYFK